MNGQHTQERSRKKEMVDEKVVVTKGRERRKEEDKGRREIKREEAEEKVRN